MAFLAALRFLTILPFRTSEPSPDDLARSSMFFPLVGLVIGVLLAIIDAVLRLFLPIDVASVLVLIVLVALTGGLHIDGLADTCDGVFSNASTPERRLEIMRDSRIGSYGSAGIALMLLLQYVALTNISPEHRPQALLLMTTLSRGAMSYALQSFPYARPQGLGTALHAGERQGTLLTMLFVLLFAIAVRGLPGVPLFAVTLLLTWALAQFFVARLNGLTGDTYGAINEVVQAAVLLTFI